MKRYLPHSLSHIVGGVITTSLAIFFPAMVILELSGVSTVS